MYETLLVRLCDLVAFLLFFIENISIFLQFTVQRLTRIEFDIREIQGVPRNMTVGEYFKMSSSIILFDTKENNNKHYMAVLL